MVGGGYICPEQIDFFFVPYFSYRQSEDVLDHWFYNFFKARHIVRSTFYVVIQYTHTSVHNTYNKVRSFIK